MTDYDKPPPNLPEWVTPFTPKEVAAGRAWGEEQRAIEAKADAGRGVAERKEAEQAKRLDALLSLPDEKVAALLAVAEKAQDIADGAGVVLDVKPLPDAKAEVAVAAEKDVSGNPIKDGF